MMTNVIDCTSHERFTLSDNTPCLDWQHDGISTTPEAYTLGEVGEWGVILPPNHPDMHQSTLGSFAAGCVVYIWDASTETYWASKVEA